MRIRSVTAHSFGPLKDETLDLADGMTVVVGDNESAKSTWHAAIFAALCGRRRGRGAPRAEEQHFVELHKPWDGGDWLVSAEVVLDDGRRIEMRQDLAGRVDCHAKDLDIGRDVSAEVINEGSPDASGWLGLDRSSFGATACVGQADMLRVLHEAGGLQEHLQRAAATAGADATAAAALECLDTFQRERVGLDRANSTKPLRRAVSGLALAQSGLQGAQRSHETYLSGVQELEGLRSEAARAAELVRAYEAALASANAGKLRERLRRASELYAKYGGVQPATPADDDALSRQVATALETWRSRPLEPPPLSRGSAVVQADIAALPEMPEGDLEVHESVQKAVEKLSHAEGQLELHERTRPDAEPDAAPKVAAGDDELLDLARVLELPLPEVQRTLVEREEAARTALAKARRGRPLLVLLMASGAVGILAGSVILAAGVLAIGGALFAVGLGLLGAATAQHRRTRSSEAERALVAAQAAVAAARQQTADAEGQRQRAIDRCRSLGLEPEASVLRGIPVARAGLAVHQRNLQQWVAQESTLKAQLAAARGELSGALTARGHPATAAQADDLADAVEVYRRACRARKLQAEEAAERERLEMELQGCLAAESRAAADRAVRGEAAQSVLAAAQACGLCPLSPEESATALETWAARREEGLSELSTAQQEWAELQAVLDGATLADLEESVSTASSRAAEFCAQVAPELLAAAEGEAAEESLRAMRGRELSAVNKAANAEGELRHFAEGMKSVAEAEETLEAAEAELARVRELDETLGLTRQFLEAAQARVHRDIAPLLANTVKSWLPRLTGGRYVDVTVDPTTLQVKVCGPSRRWRDAEFLSYGTAEQIYLLLRLALADHLTKGHDTCPLILDDVTVHADSARTLDVLELLLEVSQDRQVVLFTQEQQVADWAQAKLGPPHHALKMLAPIEVV